MSWRPCSGVTCSAGPPLALPVTCPQSSRSQRWRRDPPVTEAVAEAAAATGFRTLPGSVAKKRSGTRRDPSHFLTPCPGPQLPPGKFRPKNGNAWVGELLTGLGAAGRRGFCPFFLCPCRSPHNSHACIPGSPLLS